MKRYLLLLMLLLSTISSKTIVIVGDQNFPKDRLSKEEIKSIFLNKKRFVNGQKILAMNYHSKDPLRYCFEKNILGKTERSLIRYWRKAYYQGKRPPKIIKSIEMLFSYLENVTPSIGYSDLNSSRNHSIKVLYQFNCLKK